MSTENPSCKEVDWDKLERLNNIAIGLSITAIICASIGLGLKIWSLLH